MQPGSPKMPKLTGSGHEITGRGMPTWHEHVIIATLLACHHATRLQCRPARNRFSSTCHTRVTSAALLNS